MKLSDLVNKSYVDEYVSSCTYLWMHLFFSIAGLDLLQVLHTRMEIIAANVVESQHLLSCWLPILEAISEPAEKSRNGV
jgi:hypothetical protein